MLVRKYNKADCLFCFEVYENSIKNLRGVSKYKLVYLLSLSGTDYTEF